MAVPSSGELSLWKIMNEVDDNDYNAGSQYSDVSLKELSDGTTDTINTNSSSYPNTTAPYGMSEFYGYDHDASAPWNNNTDWFTAERGAGPAGAEKFRFDFSYNSCYNGSGTTVTDQGSWGNNGTLTNSPSFTASTSTTTPGFITFDGTDDKIVVPNSTGILLHNGIAFCIWYRCHDDHNGIMLSGDDQSSNKRLFQIKKKSNGTLGGAFYDDSDTVTTHFSSGYSNSTTTWKFLGVSCGTTSTNKGTAYRTRYYRNNTLYTDVEQVGNDNLTTSNPFKSTATSADLCVGMQEDDDNTNPFDGDIGLISIVLVDWNDDKFDSYMQDTKSKFGH